MLQDTEKQELLDKIYHLLEKHELPVTVRFLRDLQALFEPKSKDETFTFNRNDRKNRQCDGVLRRR